MTSGDARRPGLVRDALSEMTDDELRERRQAQRLYEMIAGQWVSSTVRAAATLGVMDAMAAGLSTVAEIAAEVDADTAGLTRLLRACRSLGLVQMVDDTVRPTPTGALLGSDASGSLRALAMLQGTPAVWALWGALPDAVKEGRTRAQELLDRSYFDHLGQDRAEADIFHRAMRDLTALVEADARSVVVLAGRPHVVDLGGGTGTFLQALLLANPDATGLLLDHSSQALGSAAALAESSGLHGRLEVVEGDFFEAVPTADLYVLKLVMHDWDDAECVRILQTVAQCAGPDSRLLVVEALVGDEDGDGDTLDLGAMMDMTLLAMMSGRERTLAEYDALFEQGGWVRRDVVPSRSIYSFIELTLVAT